MSKKQDQPANGHSKRMGRPRSLLPGGVPANYFARWLADKSIPVESIALVLDVNVSTVYGWRRGDRPPSRATAKRIAAITEGAVPSDSWD